MSDSVDRTPRRHPPGPLLHTALASEFGLLAAYAAWADHHAHRGDVCAHTDCYGPEMSVLCREGRRLFARWVRAATHSNLTSAYGSPKAYDAA